MKRRDFLAATAVISLLGTQPALAANKKKAQPAHEPSSKKKSSDKTSDSSKSNSKSKAADKKHEGKTKGKAHESHSTPSRAPANTISPHEDIGQLDAPVPTPNAISLPDEKPAQWKNYDVQTDVSLKGINGKIRLWVPLVQYRDTNWERSFGHRWQGNFNNAGIYRDPTADMEVFYADWTSRVDTPFLRLTSQVATQDRHFDITKRGVLAERTEILRRNLQPTLLVQTDGIVRKTAESAIGRVKDPLAQAKAIYDWVVENTEFDPSPTRAIPNDIATILERGKPRGNSTELSLLFVGLCRAMGIPARPVFGLRLDQSRLFPSLGAQGELHKAQQCRAEVYSPGYGWIPVNPADVRKAIFEERLSQSDPKLNVFKKLLFGYWEMNWISYNSAQDVTLRDSSRGTLPYLLAPVLETSEGRFDASTSSQIDYKVSATRTTF